MDNVIFHKTEQVQVSLSSTNFEIVFLPPYSPFLNPIENFFSKWKRSVRSSLPSNEEELITAIDEASLTITYCRNVLNYINMSLQREVIL